MVRRSFLFRYIIFALVATLLNLTTQRIFLNLIVSDFSIYLSIFFGTIVGLLVKFYLDKNWIFYDKSYGIFLNSKKFSLYALMGFFTTSIFWGSEIFFWYIWRTDLMRELGAIIGLSIGYLLKYKLDKKFVFNK